MSYIVNTAEHFWAEVTGTQPPSEPGAPVKGKFWCKFKRLKKSQIRELKDRNLSDDEYMDEVLLEVRDFMQDGTARDSDEAVAIIKDDVALSIAVISAFSEALAGVTAKNSNTPRGR